MLQSSLFTDFKLVTENLQLVCCREPATELMSRYLTLYFICSLGMYHVGVGLSGHGLRGVLVEKLVNLGVGKTIPHLHVVYQQYQP